MTMIISHPVRLPLLLLLVAAAVAAAVAASPRPESAQPVEVVRGVLVDPWLNDSSRLTRHQPPDVPPQPLPEEPEHATIVEKGDEDEGPVAPPEDVTTKSSGGEADTSTAEAHADQSAAASEQQDAVLRQRNPRQTQLEALLLELTVRQLDTNENVTRLTAAAANASAALAQTRTDIRRTASFVNGVTAAVERRLVSVEAGTGRLNASVSELLQTQSEAEQRWQQLADRVAELAACCSARATPAPPQQKEQDQGKRDRQLAELLAMQGVQQAEASALRRQLSRLRDSTAEARRRAAEAEAAREVRLRQLETAVARLSQPEPDLESADAAGPPPPPEHPVQTLSLSSGNQQSSSSDAGQKTDNVLVLGDLSAAGSSVSTRVVSPTDVITEEDLVTRDGAGGGTVVLGRSVQTVNSDAAPSGVVARIGSPRRPDTSGWRPLTGRESRTLPPGALVSGRPAGVVGSLSALLQGGWRQPENAIRGLTELQRQHIAGEPSSGSDSEIQSSSSESQSSNSERQGSNSERQSSSSESSSDETSEETGSPPEEEADVAQEEGTDIAALVGEILQQAEIVKRKIAAVEAAAQSEDQSTAATDVHTVVPFVPVDNTITEEWQQQVPRPQPQPSRQPTAEPPSPGAGQQPQSSGPGDHLHFSGAGGSPLASPTRPNLSRAPPRGHSVAPLPTGLVPPGARSVDPALNAPVPRRGRKLGTEPAAPVPARGRTVSQSPGARFQLAWSREPEVGFAGWRDPRLWCRPTSLYARLDGMQMWCDVNCPVCPRTHCECFWHDGTGHDLQKLR